VQIPAGDTELRTSGCTPWHLYDSTEQVGGSVPSPGSTQLMREVRKIST
jgi:hypothetical protein